MRIIKFLIYLILLILIIFVYDMTKINFKHKNKNFIEVSFDNLNSTFLKKIYNSIEAKYESFLVNNFKDHREYWLTENKKDIEKLPEFKIIKSENIFTENKYTYEKNTKDWPRSHGNSNSNRFSELQLINKKNINKLEVAWVYRSKDKEKSKWGFDVQCNPVVVDGNIFTPTSGGYIVSVDGFSGNEIWRSDKFHDDVARRGITYWYGNKIHKSRIYFSDFNYLVALNPQNGQFINSFGNKGKIKTGRSTVAPVVYKDNLVIATFEKNLEVYDLITGKLNFKVFFGDNRNDRNGGKKYDSRKGGNPWGGFSADLNRGIAYITTGNPSSYFDGTKRPGRNRYSNSIIAIDLNKKKILWDFQETFHDIWNLDIPAPPILTSVKKNNKKIDVVVAVTKRGNTLILDRLTGKPVFDLIYRKAPVSSLPGEKTWRYQLDLKDPEPFSRNIFLFSDIFSFNASNKIELQKIAKEANYGFFETYKLNKKNIQYNFHGGAEWMGASINHESQVMYVTANNIPWITEVINVDSKKYTYKSIFKRFLDRDGYPGVIPPWGVLSALNLNTGKLLWSVPFGTYEELEKKGILNTGTENFGGATATKAGIVFATGTLDKMIYAFDALNGKILWKKKLPFIGSAPPSIYLSKGEQFVVVQATGSTSLSSGYKIEKGDAIVGFKIFK